MGNLVCPECGEKVYSTDDICMNCGANIKWKNTTKKKDKKETTPSNEIGFEILADLGLDGGISEEDVRPTQSKKKKKRFGCLPVILFGIILIVLGWL